jgi:hypothetical protein
VEATRKAVAPLVKIQEPPAWADTETIAQALIAGTRGRREVTRFSATVAQTADDLRAGGLEVDTLFDKLNLKLSEERPGRLSDVARVCDAPQDMPSSARAAGGEQKAVHPRRIPEQADHLAAAIDPVGGGEGGTRHIEGG